MSLETTPNASSEASPYFSRIRLPLTRENFQVFSRLAGDDNHQAHRIIWRLFSRSPEQKRDFLYRQESRDNEILFYTVSQYPPMDDSGLFKIDFKDYRPDLPAGTKLQFSLRANPTVSKRVAAPDGKMRSQRHDVVMNLKKIKGYKELSPPERPVFQELVQEAGLAWLNSQGEKRGFVCDPAHTWVSAYERHRALKKGGQEAKFSILDYTGVLTVTEPDTFRFTLFKGLGRARGFGCGLLLVKKAP